MSDRKRKNILLVEDEILIAMDETSFLENSGYNVLTVHTGIEAVETIRKNNEIDLVLMDIHLGKGMDGVEAAELILEERDIPVIFLSNHTEPDIVEKTEKITSYGYVLKNSGKKLLETSIKMAFKLNEANQRIRNELIECGRIEEALRASERNHQKLLQDLDHKLLESKYTQLWNVYAQSHVPTFTINQAGKIININQAMIDLTGYTLKEMSDVETWIKLMHQDEETRHVLIESSRKSRNHEINIIQELYIINTKGGDKRHVIMSIYDILQNNQMGDIQIVQVEDITEKKKIEQALNESELKYRMLFKSMGQGFYLSEILYDKEGIPCDYKYIDVNSSFEQMVDLKREEIIGKTYNELVPPDPASGWMECFKRVSITGIPEVYTFSSEVYKVYFETYAFRPDEGKFAALVKDVTPRILAEKTIKDLLQEKELILKEVHHRIKNNMNVIYSLLEIQSNAQTDPDSKKILHAAAIRIQSMMVLYDKLYRSENMNAISMKDYLISLLDEIIKIFPNKTSVQIHTQFDEIILDPKIMSTIGLIINELVTNAMKSAFIGRNDGFISLSATIQYNHIQIHFEDNGIGLPDSITVENSTGFGMRLVGMLVKQINGTLNIIRQPGTKFIIEFDK